MECANPILMKVFAITFSVTKVTSSHTKGETVILTENDLDEAKLRETIDKTGYKLLSVSKAPYEKKKGFFSFLKK